MEYKCIKCNKNYKTYQTLWKHNKNFHSTNVVQVNTNVNVVNVNVNENVNVVNVKQYLCSKCNKPFKMRQGRYQHEKICKIIKEDKDMKIKELEIKLQQREEEFKNAIIEIKKEFINLLKNNKINSENLKQINNKVQCINNKYDNCNVNYGQINNTYVKFGNLDYTRIFSDKDLRKLMTTHKMKCLEELIKKTHFNDKYPEYGNIFITNLRDNIAYIFDGKEFIATNRTATLVDLVDNHTNEINLSLDNHRAKLDEYTITKIEEMLNKLESNDKFIDVNNNKTYGNYKVYKLNNITTDIYNLSDRKKLEVLQTMKLIEKSYDDELLSEDSNYDVKSITV